MSDDTHNLLAAMPKIELHRHLEGSIRVETMAELGRTHRLPLPTYDAAELSKLVCHSSPAPDLQAFLLPFKLIKLCFADRDCIARLTYEAVEDAASDRVSYLELRFSPEYMAVHRRLPLHEVMAGVVEGSELANRRLNTTTRLIVSITRGLDRLSSEQVSWPTPSDIVSLALEYADRGVVGVDLAGLEAGYPPRLYAECFAEARSAGLGISVHAGEDDGPASIREAVEILGADRIAHGVRITDDADVVRLVGDRGVCLDMCPTSNVLTHAVESLESHPIRKLHVSGVRVTVNTDDPTICQTTLTRECSLLVDKLGFTVDDIRRLMANACAARFAQDGPQETATSETNTQYRKLKTEN